MYDLLYSDKDYERECDVVLELAGRHCTRPVRRILDLGAGTGGHAIPLARRGYEVTAVDRSRGMLEAGRAKADAADVRVRWLEQDLAALDAGGPFDLALAMFAVLGYLATNDALRGALGRVRGQLAPGALFLFDVWHGAAILHVGPTTRVKRAERDGVRLVRTTTPTLRPDRDVCVVDQHALVIDRARVVEEIRESHEMRYFFAPELELLLSDAGFAAVLVYPFPDASRAIGLDDWDLGVVARAV